MRILFCRRRAPVEPLESRLLMCDTSHTGPMTVAQMVSHLGYSSAVSSASLEATPTAPVALAVVDVPAVNSFTLINADTDQPIAGFEPFPNGATLNLATLPTRNLNVRANTSPAAAGSVVVFGLDSNPAFRTESVAPYALAGDANGNYAPWTPSVGQHTINATPYSGPNGSGAAGLSRAITFNVVDQLPGPTLEVILDNSSSAVTFAGSWPTATQVAGFQGTNYQTDGNTGKGSKSATYRPSLTASGTYQVFARWTASGDRATNVPIDVNHGGGTTTVTVNQRLNHATWVSLGTFGFAAGSAGSVVIRNAGTNGLVIADAVKFVRVDATSNQAPVVSAGPDLSITLPSSASLDGSVSDDGRPSGTLTIGWSKVSGPGTVTFSNPAAADTDAGFSSPGSYVLRLTASDGALASSDDVAVTVAATPGSGQTPFSGSPTTLPAMIQAEDFDNGGEGIAYHDTDSTNQGGSYRSGVGVDIEPSSDTGGGVNIGHVKAGEWLEYTVNVPANANYDLEVRVASGNPGGTFHLEVDGVNKTGTMTLPNTGGWQTWQTVTKSAIALTAGNHVLRLAIDTSANGGDVGNLNWLRLTPSSTPNPTQTPFSGSPVLLPATIQSEDFDNGGEGVAYHDTDSTNQGGSYRSGVGVDIEPSSDTGSGFAIGNVKAGEWLEYTVNVPSAGAYDLQVRFASGSSGGTGHLEVDGINVSGAFNLPNTGGWQTWETVTKPNIALPAGNHVLRLAIDSSAGGGDVGNLNWLRLSPTSSNPGTNITWTQKASAPLARDEAQGTVVGEKLYVFGGFYTSQFLATTRVDVYDPAINSWSPRAAMPEALTHSTAVYDGRYVWLVAGYVGNDPGPGTNHVWKYDPAADSWTRGPDLPEARGAGAGALLGRELHYFGGMNATRTADQGSHWVLNVDSGTAWSARAAMPNPRNHLAATALNGKVYAIGGQFDEVTEAVDTRFVHAYDPATDAWTRVADLPAPRSHFNSSSFIRNDRIMVIGGESAHNAAQANVWEYNPTGDLWAIFTNLPDKRRAAVAGYINGKIIVTGGYDNFSHQTTTWSGG